MSFRREVPRGMSLIRYWDTPGGHGDLIDEGPAMDEVNEVSMTGRVVIAFTEESAFTAEVGEDETLPAGLEDSQSAIRKKAWEAILTVEGAVEGAADAPTAERADYLLLLTTLCDCYS